MACSVWVCSQPVMQSKRLLIKPKGWKESWMDSRMKERRKTVQKSGTGVLSFKQKPRCSRTLVGQMAPVADEWMVERRGRSCCLVHSPPASCLTFLFWPPVT